MIIVVRYLFQSFCLLAFLSGCADLPARLPLSASESSLARESFKEMISNQRQCKSSVDADITVTFASKFYSGTMSGYLQAKAPAYLKLVGINPFGQPLVVLVSDGTHFNYTLFNESISYDGNVDSDSFQRFAPSGFDPGNSFYLMTGKLPPGEVRILATDNDPEGHGVWVEIEGVLDSIRRLVLFDPGKQQILKYLQFDKEDDVTLQVAYGNYYPGLCSLPGLITVTSNDHYGRLSVRLNDWQTETPFSAADFELESPLHFKRVKVN